MHGGIVESPGDETSKIYQSSSSVAGGKRPFFIYLATILSAIGGFLFGYDTGVVSGAMILLKDTFNLSSTWQEIIVSSTVGMAWLFSLLTGYMADFFGRKPVILLASVVFTAGAIMMGVATGKYILLGGRLIVGAGIGIASMSVPVYIGEVAPADIRGLMVTLYQICIAFGMFIASVVAGAFSTDTEDGWRWMLGLAAVPSFFQFFGFLMMPESPRWLVGKHKYEQAVAGLRKLRGETANIELEFEAIKANCLEVEKEQETSSGTVLFQVLRHRALRRALVLGCLLQTFQQICGINTVMYYSATIIQMAGFHDPSKAIWLSTATSGVNFVVGFIGMYLVEKIGRRPLFLGSMAGVAASLILLAIGFHITALKSPHITDLDPGANKTPCYTMTTCKDCVLDERCGYCFNYTETMPYFGTCSPVNLDDTSRAISGACNTHHIEEPLTWAYEWCPTAYSWIILLGLISYLFFFSPGMGPMPWAINTEIFPLWARGTCFAVSTSFNWLFNLVIAMTFLTLTETITKFGTFYLYTGLAIFGWIIFYFMLPETKGKPLEEVENLFANSWFIDRSATTKEPKTSEQLPINTRVDSLDSRVPISKSNQESPPAYGTINSAFYQERQPIINGNKGTDSEYTKL